MITLTDSTLKIAAAAAAAHGAIILVEYAGSITDAWGPATLIGPSARGTGRYDLRTASGDTLRGARAESFTLA